MVLRHQGPQAWQGAALGPELSCLGQLPWLVPGVCPFCSWSARTPCTQACPVLRDLDPPQRGPLEARFLGAASFQLLLTSAWDFPVHNPSYTLSAAAAARLCVLLSVSMSRCGMDTLRPRDDFEDA